MKHLTQKVEKARKIKVFSVRGIAFDVDVWDCVCREAEFQGRTSSRQINKILGERYQRKGWIKKLRADEGDNE